MSGTALNYKNPGSHLRVVLGQSWILGLEFTLKRAVRSLKAELQP